MEPRTLLLSTYVCLFAFMAFNLTCSSWSAPPPPASCGTPLQDKILSQLFVGYNNNIRPPGTTSTNITVQLRILNIVSVDEKARLWTINLFIGHNWNDSRLQYQDQVGSCTDIPFIQLTTVEAVDRAWRPDYSFNDQVHGEVHELLHRNRVMRLYPSGRVSYSAHVSLTLFCTGEGSAPGEFKCPIEMEAYGQTSYIRLKWRSPSPVGLDAAKISLENHVLGDIQTTEKINLGQFSALVATFPFRRKTCLQ